MTKVTISREGANPITILQNPDGNRLISRESDSDEFDKIKRILAHSKNFKDVIPKELSTNKADKSFVSTEYSEFARTGEKIVSYGDNSDIPSNSYSSDGTIRKVISYAISKIKDDIVFDDELKEITNFLSTNNYILADKTIPPVRYFGVYEGKSDTFPRYLTANLILPFKLNMDTLSNQGGLDTKWCKRQQEILKNMLIAFKNSDSDRLKSLKDEYTSNYNSAFGKFLEFYNAFVGKLFSSAGGAQWANWSELAEYFGRSHVFKFINAISEYSDPFIVAPWMFNAAKFKNGQLYREVKFGLSSVDEDACVSKAVYYLDIAKVYKCSKSGMFGSNITLERDGKTY